LFSTAIRPCPAPASIFVSGRTTRTTDARRLAPPMWHPDSAKWGGWTRAGRPCHGGKIHDDRL
jgi:hypothetical protein